MIARELTEFFAGFAPDGGPALHRAGDLTFLSNVNACYSRACWEELRFPDARLLRGPGLRPRDARGGLGEGLPPGRRRAPRARLRSGRVHEALLRRVPRPARVERPRGAAGAARGRPHEVRGRRPLDARARLARAAAGALAGPLAVHHGGRRAASALGSRAGAPARRRCSARCRWSAAARWSPRPPRSTLPRGRYVSPSGAGARFEEMLRLSARGRRAARRPPCRAWPSAPLHVAVVIPPFMRGSGGHNTIFTLLGAARGAGPHLLDLAVRPAPAPHARPPRCCGGGSCEEFVPRARAGVQGLRGLAGADVVLATAGTPSTPPLLLPGLPRPRLPRSRTTSPSSSPPRPSRSGRRAPTSSASTGSPRAAGCATCSPSATARRGSWFRLGVDHGVYRPRPVERRRDTVIFYAREFTPRRAVPLGALALEELKRRRPDTRVVLFGQAEELRPALRVRAARRDQPRGAGLALLRGHRRALPLAHQLLADPAGDDGLRAAVRGPRRRLDRGGARARRRCGAGRRRPAGASPTRSSGCWPTRSTGSAAREAGLAFVETASWDVAAKQVEAGLREALRRRGT